MKHECVMGHKLWFAFTLEAKASSDYILRPCEEYDTIFFFFLLKQPFVPATSLSLEPSLKTNWLRKLSQGCGEFSKSLGANSS